MSDLNLIDVVNLIRAEIARTEIGDVKRIIGPQGEQGPQGDTGPQGPQGPRGNDGKQGPAGAKGNQGKKGDKGVKGDDGADGVGIARVEQDIDNAIVVHLTDGNYYTIEMPLINDDGSLAKEVHYKSGGGGSGVVDLSGYVKRPSDTHGGKWLLYREPDGTNRGEWAPATTDLIETNGMLMFRDIKGRFKPTPEELENINTQLKANRFMWEKIQELDLKAGGVAISPDAPDNPDNGMFWFDNTEDVMQLFIWHKDSDAWIPVAPPTTLDARVSAGEATQQAIITQIQQSLDDQARIVAKVEELTITKGAVARYVVTDTSISGVASRNGELYVSSPTAADVQYLSFAPFDSNGQTTKPCNPDDIVEFVEAAGGRNAGDVTRYKVISGDYNALTVEYLSGTNDFEVGEAEEVYIYPQNSDLATIEYVDAQDELLQIAVSSNAIAIGSKADKSYVDAQDNGLTQRINERVRLYGDNNLTDEWRIKQQNTSGNNNTLIVAKDGELKLYHVKYPTSDDHAASMKYVDDEIAKIVIPDIPEIPEVEEAIQPLLWEYMGQSVEAVDLEPGQFTYRYSGSQGSAEGWVKIYTSIYDASGQTLASQVVFQHDMTDKMFLSMMNADGGMGIHMKAKTLYFNQGNSGAKYHRFEGKFWRVAKSTVTGKKFILNVPGFLPTFGKPSDIASFSLPDEPPCGDIPPEADE